MPIEITMPALSPTMTEGKLAKWLVREGDNIKAGKIIAEIETDKATMEVESVDEGILGKILVKEGTEGVAVNSIIALLLAEGEDKKSLDSYKVKETTPEKKPAEAEKTAPVREPAATFVAPQVIQVQVNRQVTAAPKSMAVSSRIASAGERVKASPLARRTAEQLGVDIGSIIGTGPHGRIIKEDVELTALRGSGVVIRRDPVEFETIPHSMMRKTVAKRLTESKQFIPHFYLTIDCELDNLLEIRRQLNEKAESDAGKGNKPAYKLSVNDFVIKASAIALRRVPGCNASWYDDAVVQYNNIDISVAVAIDGGLITPIIHNADQKSLPQISEEMKELAARARANKLKPEEYTGGGFSISNLGMYGIKKFSAIINPPQSCILAVGAGELRPVVRKGHVVSAHVMSVTLSVDHRAVDGALGARFLAEFKQIIESPISMFI